ncbi:hypothetical protein Bbelb_300530 [Branchiostoma belcheri]|nr:hypothetical protein Bbelb_300530 [Branchiostoma belcheri]
MNSSVFPRRSRLPNPRRTNVISRLELNSLREALAIDVCVEAHSLWLKQACFPEIARLPVPKGVRPVSKALPTSDGRLGDCGFGLQVGMLGRGEGRRCIEVHDGCTEYP